MAKNIDFMGAIFPDVPSVKLPQQGGGLVSFDDTTDATATADKILQGYTAYANGEKLVGTASGGGESRLELLGTKSLGTISTTSTSEVSTGQTMTLSKDDYNDYEFLVVICTVDSRVDNRHVGTITISGIYGDIELPNKNSVYQPSFKTNYKLVNGTLQSRSVNNAYGIYAKASISGSTMTLTFYQRYNSLSTGMINGNYTAHVYGLKLYDLI